MGSREILVFHIERDKRERTKEYRGRRIIKRGADTINEITEFKDFYTQVFFMQDLIMGLMRLEV